VENSFKKVDNKNRPLLPGVCLMMSMVVHVQNNLHLIRLEAKRYRQLIGHLYKGM